MSDAASKPDNSPVAGETGRILRNAREAKGLSVREVADSLHLRPSIVMAIEEGDYRQVPGELFLRGYVKSYARHMSLSEAPLLASLDEELGVFREADDQRSVEHPLEQIERAKGRRQKWARSLVVILFLLAAGLVFTEFSGRTHLFLPRSQPVPNSQPAPASEPPPAPTKPSPEATNSTAEASPVATPAESGAVTAPDQPADTTASSQNADAGKGAAQAGTAATHTPPSSAATPQAAAVASAAADQPATEVSSGKPEPAPGPVDTLTMTFSGDCWVEVTNGAGNRVVAALKRNGDMLHYVGHGPFKIVLGAVGGVSSLSFNGKTMDLSKYPAPGHRAEFVLGK